MITLMIFFGVVGKGNWCWLQRAQEEYPVVCLVKGETHSFLFIIFSIFGKIFSDGSPRWLRHDGEVMNEGQSVITWWDPFINIIIIYIYDRQLIWLNTRVILYCNCIVIVWWSNVFGWGVNTPKLYCNHNHPIIIKLYLNILIIMDSPSWISCHR